MERENARSAFLFNPRSQTKNKIPTPTKQAEGIDHMFFWGYDQ